MARRCAGVLLLLLCLSCTLHSVEGSWWKNMIDPGVSLWSPFAAGSTDMSQTEVGFGNFVGSVACFGDFDGDGYTDIFTLSKQSEYDQLVPFTFADDLYQPVLNAGVSEPSIVSAAASDFNYDGMLDVVVQGLNNASLPFMNVYFGNLNIMSEAYPVPSPPDTADQVLLLDANMDMKVDMFGKATDGSRVFWINQGDGINWDVVPLAGSEDMPPIDTPHSNAFVDINGDCLSDLVITSRTENGTRQLEVWLNSDATGSPEFTLANVINLPEGAGQVTFSDLNRDGTMDFVFPVCWPQPNCSETNSIMVAYNKQQEMCTSITGGGDDCMPRSEICLEAEYELPTDFTGNGTVEMPSSSFADGATFYWNYNLNRMPNTLHAGDWNLDGYDDLLVTVVVNNVRTVQLWESYACGSSDDAVCDESQSSYRYFAKQDSGTAVLSNYTTAFTATWFDIADDGTLDIILLSDSSSDLRASTKTVATVSNDVDHGGFFVKALGLNGLCPQWCLSSDVQPSFPDPKPVGVNMPGVVFKYTQTGNDWKTRLAAGAALTQSAYLSLQTPYAFFGIGDEGNFVSSLYIGIPITGSKSKFSSFPDVLPNSNVVVFPSPPTSVFRWTVDMRLMPSGLTFWTIFISIMSCLLLSIPVVILAYKETKEDKIEAQEMAQLFAL